MSTPKIPASGNLSDRVVRYLIDYTRKHRLKSGEEVPSEGTLSNELKVSRGVVREAYRSLKTAGILDISNGRSPRVGRLSNQAFSQFLNHALHTEQASTADVLDVRRSIEVRAAELAAQHRTDEQAVQLQHEAETMRASVKQRRRFINADMRFHEVLGRATGNPLFSLIGNALRESLDVTIRAGFDSRRTAAQLNRVAQIHLDLAAAIAARSATRARRVMQTHFDEARVFIAPLEQTTASRPRRRAVRAAS
jgi:DNA-binding FadR family transcriptional regulator